MYKKASKLGLRFKSGRGLVNVEDLWVLSLTDLDKMAITIDTFLEAGKKKSFISQKAKEATSEVLRLEILKDVISTRLEEKAIKKLASEKKAQYSRIKELIAQKEDAALGEKSADELKTLLAELGEV